MYVYAIMCVATCVDQSMDPWSWTQAWSGQPFILFNTLIHISSEKKEK